MKDFQAPTEAYKPSGERPTLQNIKDIYFFTVVDPNPDLAFQVNPDPVPDLIQWIRIRINDQKLEKNTGEIFFIFDRSKFANYLYMGLLKGRPSYRRSLQPSEKNIQHLKKLNAVM